MRKLSSFRVDFLLLAAAVWTVLAGPATLRAADPPSKEAALAAMRQATDFFRQQVAADGAYLWRYSDDLSLREGEGAATVTMGWVQPPGTPAVGQALLTAYERTGEPFLLDAAEEAAQALVAGQLASGGWDYQLETDPAKRRAGFRFRADESSRGKQNTTTLDDNTTQSAIRFLMHVDHALEQKNAKIHEAARFALDSLIKAQYPSGAWPQRYSEPPDPAKFPALAASFPESWPREWPKEKYASYYTLNDNTLADCIDVMFEAAEVYGDERYAAAARRGGDFLIRAQLPDPQPAWAQQYNAAMQPAWARKFEPPGVTGGESQGAIRILMEVYRQTGDRKYLAPIPRALEYLEKSQLPGGKLARFYELQTNRPLYFTKQYELVYTADDLPTHYAFIVSSNVERLRSQYERLAALDPTRLKTPPRAARYEKSAELAKETQRAIDSLDPRGAWVEAGKLKAADPEGRVTRVITTSRFIDNMDALSRWVAAHR
jgi:hypothetical protein